MAELSLEKALLIGIASSFVVGLIVHYIMKKEYEDMFRNVLSQTRSW